MAEIDTRPLESVQSALNLFEQRGDHSRFSSPDRNEQEIDVVTRELATCKLQLEAKESENKQANLQLEAMRKAMQELSEKYDQACLEAHRRITDLETDNVAIAGRQSRAAAECEALHDELAVAMCELEAVKRANEYVLGEVESMETRRILERESARDGLMRVLELNESVLESAVAAIRAEEERSVFFQEVTLELFSSDRNLETIRGQKEAMESMEGELLAKTLEIECLRSELMQLKLKELYVSSSEQVMVPAASTTVPSADGGADTARSGDDVGDVNAGKPDNGKGCQEPGGEVAGLVDGCPEVAEAYFDSELPREDGRNIRSGDGDINVSMSAGHVVKGQAEPKRRVRFMPESPMEDFKSVNSEYCKYVDFAVGMSENVAGKRGSEPEAAGAGSGAEIVVVNSNEADGDGEFFTKEITDGDGYVLVAKKADGGAMKDEKLEAAQAEMSDLRFSLEEALRRAELAEEGKAALERQLREELLMKQQRPPRPRAPAEDGRLRRVESTPAAPSRRRPTPSRSSGSATSCLTLGKALNMKYK